MLSGVAPGTSYAYICTVLVGILEGQTVLGQGPSNMGEAEQHRKW